VQDKICLILYFFKKADSADNNKNFFQIFFDSKIMCIFATVLQKSDMVPAELLKEHNLSITRIRLELLKQLLKSEVALSPAELSCQLKTECDRVTLYRNLKAFVEKGIVHQIFVDNHESKYVLPERNKGTGKNEIEHIHFKCVRCNVVKCLHNYPVIPVELPEGFVKLETNYVIFGLCNACSKKAKLSGNQLLNH